MTNRWWPRRAQGAYYVLTGLWPIIDLRGYMAATGQESHGEVAMALGGAVALAGLALAAGVLPARAARYVGIGSALALGVGGAAFAAQGRGRTVNVTDAALQAAFALSWLLGERER